jgi:uncharacterized membrane protein YhaH (DUF805 family)
LKSATRQFAHSIAANYFRPSGRLSRRSFWISTLIAWLAFWLAFGLLDAATTLDLTRIPAAILCWVLYCLCARRYHDLERSPRWLLALLIPILGVVWVCSELGFRRGTVGDNHYGTDPLTDLGHRAADYATVR